MKHCNNGVITVAFTSFGRECVGRLVTEERGYGFVNTRNPYGSHNLVVVELASEEAVAHGIEASIREAFYSSKKAYRKVRTFLANTRPDTTKWVVTS